MNLFNWANKQIKKLKWYDISLVKLSVLFSTLFLITAWSGFRNLVLSFSWYWYLIITIALMIPVLKKMFFD
ncbi:hypothetical protein HN587_01555 [Candidatus Woesearchaeota archaeon]|jgi:hypothetical protein|nr:hypothetical protein [Candidatus Woesearchaeota archaeon]